jgi:hypothetical protein
MSRIISKQLHLPSTVHALANLPETKKPEHLKNQQLSGRSTRVNVISGSYKINLISSSLVFMLK